MSLPEYIQGNSLTEEDISQLKKNISTLHNTFKFRHNDIRLDNIGINLDIDYPKIILLCLNRITE